MRKICNKVLPLLPHILRQQTLIVCRTLGRTEACGTECGLVVVVERKDGSGGR